MSRSVGEDDLLAWIEGELSPEDQARVAGLLESDPELRAWADRVREDRDLLREWGRAGATVAPKDLVEHAVAMAEREALLDTEHDHSLAFGRSGSFRLFTTGRIAMAAGLLLALTAGYFALPALQGPTPAPIQTTPSDGAGTAVAMEDAAGQDPAAPDTTPSVAQARRAQELFESEVAPPTTMAAEPNEPRQVADAGRADTLDDMRLGAGIQKEATSGDLATPAVESEVQLADAAVDVDEVDLATDVDADAGADETNAFGQPVAEMIEEEPAWVVGESSVLALLNEMEGWSVLESPAPDAQPGDFQPMRAIGPEGDEKVERARDEQPAPMGLDEANRLALNGMLLITIEAASAADAAAQLVESGQDNGVEILEVSGPDNAEPRLLAIVTDTDGVEPLLNLISASNVGVMHLREADAPSPEIIELDAVAWWTLPINEWVDAHAAGVQIRVRAVAADGADAPEQADEPDQGSPEDAPGEAAPEESPPVEPPLD